MSVKPIRRLALVTLGVSSLVSVTFAVEPLFPDPGFPAQEEPWDLAAGDFNSDGHLDLVVPGRDSCSHEVRLGWGDGTFILSAVQHGGFGVSVGDCGGVWNGSTA